MNRRYGQGLIALVLAVGFTACTEGSSDQWKPRSDPAIVDFPIENAETVDRELVDLPFLRPHEQVASGTPRIGRHRPSRRWLEVEFSVRVGVIHRPSHDLGLSEPSGS